MPRKEQPTYVVIMYQVGSSVAISGSGGFWRMVWQVVGLLCRCRWQIVVPTGTMPPGLRVLLDDAMNKNKKNAPEVMH